MKFNDVRRQLDEVYQRAIRTGVSVRQNYPAIEEGRARSIGSLSSSTIALRDAPYPDIYMELERNNQFHLKLPDGALLIFQYLFDGQGDLTKHRLGFFPCPALPSVEEAPELYSHDDLYADIIAKRIVRFPIRFDFDPSNYTPVVHAHSHITLGQFDNCRIPASHPFSPNSFLTFILKNFYFFIYVKHKNVFEKRISRCPTSETITESEKRFHFVAVRR